MIRYGEMDGSPKDLFTDFISYSRNRTRYRRKRARLHWKSRRLWLSMPLSVQDHAVGRFDHGRKNFRSGGPEAMDCLPKGIVRAFASRRLSGGFCRERVERQLLQRV